MDGDNRINSVMSSDSIRKISINVYNNFFYIILSIAYKSRHMPTALILIERGVFDLKSLITHKYKLKISR